LLKTWNIDSKLKDFIMSLHDNVNTILLGRKMTEGSVNHWENVKHDSPEYSLAEKMVNTPKVIFTKTLDEPIGKNTVLAKGNLADEIANLKKQNGKDIIVYGGAGFVSSLIAGGHIDEFNLFVNPVAIGNGMTIFKRLENNQNLTLKTVQQFDCGIALLRYELKKD